MRRTTLWLCGMLSLTTPLAADVAVVPEAAHTGSYGLRATVEPPCQGEETILVLGPVVTPQRVEACKEIVVGSQVQDGGELVTLAGQRVTFADGFSVASGGSLVAGTTGAWHPSYVIDETPASESELHVQWYARFDEAGLATGESVTVLRVISAGVERGWVRYGAGPGGGEVWVEVVGDDGQRWVGARSPLGAGWHRLELDWAAGSMIQPTGAVSVTVDDGSPLGVQGVELGGGLVDAVHLGVVQANSASGWLDLDDYQTTRSEPFASESGPLGERR